MDEEAFYDDVVGPMLRDLTDRCAERGMSLVAAVQFADEGVGSTVKLAERAHPTMRMAAYAARSKGNVDGLIFALIEDGKKHGHNSICIHKLTRE